MDRVKPKNSKLLHQTHYLFVAHNSVLNLPKSIVKYQVNP
jgi:hypothetical protein